MEISQIKKTLIEVDRFRKRAKAAIARIGDQTSDQDIVEVLDWLIEQASQPGNSADLEGNCICDPYYSLQGIHSTHCPKYNGR